MSQWQTRTCLELGAAWTVSSLNKDGQNKELLTVQKIPNPVNNPLSVGAIQWRFCSPGRSQHRLNTSERRETTAQH